MFKMIGYLTSSNCKREEFITPVQMYIWHQIELTHCRRHCKKADNFSDHQMHVVKTTIDLRLMFKTGDGTFIRFS